MGVVPIERQPTMTTVMQEKDFPVSFQDFLASLKRARFKEYAQQPDVTLANAKEFAKMKTYLLKRYNKLTVIHSFRQSDGSVYDCVPIEHQPLQREYTTAMDAPSLPAPPHPSPESSLAQNTEKLLLAHTEPALGCTNDAGKPQDCPAQTIPVRRLTLEEMTHCKTLREFFQKSPGSAAMLPK
jgi:hypothetical protein